MEPIAVTVIVSYLLLVTLVGSLLARRAGGSKAWAVGGGQMGVLMIAAGIAGTRIGGVGTYGVASGSFSDSLGMFSANPSNTDFSTSPKLAGAG